MRPTNRREGRLQFIITFDTQCGSRGEGVSVWGSRSVGIALAIVLSASAVGVLADFPGPGSGPSDSDTVGTETGAAQGGTVGIGDGWEPRGPPTPLPDTPINGASRTCDDATILGFGPLGWTWVDPENRIQQVTGVAVRSRVTHSDFPATHDSHDHNLDVFVDPGQDGLVSDVGIDHDGDGTPDTLEVEWEIGTFPSETRSDPERTFRTCDSC